MKRNKKIYLVVDIQAEQFKGEVTELHCQFLLDICKRSGFENCYLIVVVPFK